MRRSLLLLMAALLLSPACGGKSAGTGDGDVPAGGDAREVREDGPTCALPCEIQDDCAPSTECVISRACVDGCCQVELEPVGTPCHEGCAVGTCGADGACENRVSKDCPEEDGNLCTTPACQVETGQCKEVPRPDGPVPVDSACWTDLVCVDGEPDAGAATPSELNLQCQAESTQLDPFGCVQKVACQEAQQACVPVFKSDGTACWPGEGGTGAVCKGHACQGGECNLEPDLHQECAEQDFPEDCDEDCRGCTSLTCYWIPDPKAETPTTKVRYCKPEADVGSNCSDGDGCTDGDACVLGQQGQGPLGKETLGACQAGPPKACPTAGCAKATCDSETGECGFTNLNHEYCEDWSSCLHKSDQHKCDPTHPDADPGTGCTFKLWKDVGAACSISDACVEEAECVTDPGDATKLVCQAVVEKTCADDFNPCTDDFCEDVDGVAVCKHVPDDTNACDDGNLCTVGDACVGGSCVSGGQTPCEDEDDNPCNGPSCEPETGECVDAPMEEGAACAWDGLCAIKTCQSGACTEIELVSDGTPDVCDGVDNDCDGKTDENCYVQYTVTGHAWTAGRTEATGDAGALKGSLAHPVFDKTTTDGTYTIHSGLPEVTP